MSAFDALSPAIRALLLAKLNLEIMSAHCANISDLAKKRNQTVSEVWRDICKKAGQARCVMPPEATTKHGECVSEISGGCGEFK